LKYKENPYTYPINVLWDFERSSKKPLSAWVCFSFYRLGLNIGLMPLSGLFEIVMANDIVPVKNGPSFMEGDPHDYYLGGSRSNEISGRRSPEIVE
jgi:hypothetical protein